MLDRLKMDSLIEIPLKDSDEVCYVSILPLIFNLYFGFTNPKQMLSL